MPLLVLTTPASNAAAVAADTTDTACAASATDALVVLALLGVLLLSSSVHVLFADHTLLTTTAVLIALYVCGVVVSSAAK